MHAATVVRIVAWLSWASLCTAAQLSPRIAVLSPLPSGSALINNSWQAGLFVGRPRRAASPIYISVEENGQGPFPQLLDTLPADGDELFFTLTGQGADQPPEGLFIIEEFVPELSITAALDREEHPEFKLTCSQTTDSGAELEPIIVIIKVVDQNDNSPEFAQATLSKEMSEASPMGTSVWTISASDKDDPSTPNAQIAYKIISETSAFSIEEQSGVITVSESGLDREAMASHSLEVVAADLNGAGGGLSATATLVITVTDANDHPPRFTSAQASATVGTNKVGTEVLRLSVDDADEKGTANWRTIYRAESGDPGVHFSIQTDAASNQAIITIAKAFEEDGTYQLTLAAENEAELVVARSEEQTCTVTIAVSIGLKPAEPQQRSVMHVSIEENDGGPFPKSIITVPGEEHELLFSLTGTGVDAPPEGLFVVEELTGEISVTGSIDREEHPTFEIVCSRFKGDNTLWGEAVTLIITVIDKNDNSPEIFETTLRVELSEAATAGTVVVTVSASDKDDPETPNAQIRYKLLTEMSTFSLEETSGKITVSQSTLDREDTAEYTLEVEARDCDGHSNGLFAQATVHITIADVNDNAPTFTREEIQVTVNKGSRDITIATIAVEDRDEKLTENWRAIYKISGNTEEIFSISTDPNTNEGVLRLAKEIYTDMELQVLVENEVPLVAWVEETSVAGRTCRVFVSMLGEVGRIQFVPPVTKVHIQETVLAGQILAVLSAQDTENNSNENMRYAIHEDESNLLDIDAATGKLSARADLKRDSPFLQNDKYTALVTATLEGEEFGTATGTVLIVVRDSDSEDSESDSGQRPIVLHTTACVRDENSSVSIDIAATDAQGAFVGSPPFEFFVDSQDQGWVITQMDGSRAKLSVESGTLPCGDYFIPVMGVDAAGSELGLSVQLTVCRCEDGPAIIGVLPVQDGKTGLCLSSGGLAAILCSIIAAPLLGVVFLALLRKWFTRREVENKGFIQAASSDDVQCESQGQRRLETVVEEVNVESSTSTHRSASGSRPTLLMEKSTKIRHSETTAMSKGDQKTLTCVHEDSLSQSRTKAKKEHIAEEEESLMRATGALISDINAGQTNVNVSRLNYRDETEGQEDASMEVKVKATRSVEVLSEQDLVRYNRTLNGQDKVSVDFGNSHASSCHLQLQDKATTVIYEKNVEVIYGSEDGGDLEYKGKSANVLKSEHMATCTVTSNKGDLKTKHNEKLEVRDLNSTGAFSRADSEMGLRMSQAVMQQAYRQGVNVLPDTPVRSLHTTHSNTLEAGTGTATHLPGSSLAVSRQNSGAKTKMQVSSLHVKSADHLTSVDFGSRPAASDTVSTNDSVSSVYHGHSSNMVIPAQTKLFADHQSMDTTATFMSLVKSEQSEITNSSQSRDVSKSGSRQGSNTFKGNEVMFDSSSTLQGSGVQDRSSLSTKTMNEGRSVTPAVEAVKHARDYPMLVTSGDCQGASGATFSKASRSTISSYSSSQPSSTTTQTEPLSPSQFREEPGQLAFQSSEVIIESQAGDTVKFGTKQTSKTSDIRRVQFDNASQEDHSLSGNTKLILEGRRTDVSSLAGGTHIIDIQEGMQYSTVVGNRSKGTSIGGVPEIITSASTYSTPVSTHQSLNMQTEPSKTLLVKSVQHSVVGGQEGNIATAGTGLIQGSSSSFSAGETTSVKTTMLSSQTLNKSKDSSSEAKVLHSKPRQCNDSSSDVHGETLQSLECSGMEFEHRVIQRMGSQEQQSVLETMNSAIEGKQKYASPSLKSDTKVIFKKQRSYTGDVEFGVQSTTRANSINSSSGFVSSLSSIQQNKIQRPLLPALATSLEHTVGDTSEVYSTSADIWSKKSSLSSFSSDEHSRTTIQGQTISSIPANKGKRLDITESFTASTRPDGLRQGSVQLKCPEELSKKQEKENQAGNLVTQNTYFSSIQKKPQKEMTNASNTSIESGTAKPLSESTQLNTKLKPAENPIPLCTNKTLVQPSSITNSGIQHADKMPNSVSIRGSEASAITKLHGSSLGAGLSNAQGKWESSGGVPTALAATGSKGHGIVSEEFGHKQLTSPTKSIGQSHYASKSSSTGTISSDMGGGGRSTSYQISASDNTVEGHVKHAMSLSQQATKYHLQPLHEAVAPVKGAAFSASLEQHSLWHQQNVSGASGRELLETADKSQAQLGGMVSTIMTSAPHVMQLQHSVTSVQSQAGKVSQSVQLQRNMTRETTASQRTNQSDHREKEVSSHTSIHAKPSISGSKQARGGDETIRIVIDESNVTPEEEAGYFRSFHRYESGQTSLGTGFYEVR